jgi:hypothetical protein
MQLAQSILEEKNQPLLVAAFCLGTNLLDCHRYQFLGTIPRLLQLIRNFIPLFHSNREIIGWLFWCPRPIQRSVSRADLALLRQVSAAAQPQRFASLIDLYHAFAVLYDFEATTIENKRYPGEFLASFECESKRSWTSDAAHGSAPRM